VFDVKLVVDKRATPERKSLIRSRIKKNGSFRDERFCSVVSDRVGKQAMGRGGEKA